MNATQARIAAKMLELAKETYRYYGVCELENTPENLEFAKGMIAMSDNPDDEPNISKDGNTICLSNWEVMRYCARLLREEAK